MDNLGIFYPEGHQNHEMFGHPERPERVEVIRQGLEEIDLWESTSQIQPVLLASDLLETVHSPDYLRELEASSLQAAMLDPDTYTTRDSWQLALNAAGGTTAIVEAVWERKIRSGLALARPPGHHATQDRGMGFCLINNIAIGAEYLIQSKNAKSILILDLDLHHGNGTQDIFWARPEVGFCSIHQAPFYPGTGSLAEIGAGDGKGKTLNLPIPSYSGDQAYQTLLSEVIFPFMMEMQPEMVLVSFGFDTHWRDPLGSMQVSAECVYLIMKDLQQWSEENCNGRLAVILEGGYDLEAGKACGQAIGTALTGVDWDDPLGPSPVPEKDNWKDTLEAVRRKLKY
jgi:acetoin utilization deacetylase AcuC-like enzyme